MLVEKEVIRPGTYWYRDQETDLPRKLVVTPELTKYWSEQGNAMLSAGLTVPVPFEHDFDAHPMTPADKLKNNAGWVKEYRLKGDNGDRLFGVVDVQDEGIAAKLPGTIRWTSPWINSFTDGAGKEWKNVISHLALTTRPRIVEQAPFGSVAAALSIANSIKSWDEAGAGGVCLSIAGRVVRRKRDRQVIPLYPIAFSMYSGAALGNGDMPPPKAKGKKPPIGKGSGGGGGGGGDDDEGDMDNLEGDDDATDEMDGMEEMDGSPMPDDGDPSNDSTIDLPPFNDPAGDIGMEELLCDLLQALGVPMPDASNEAEFKRHLYEAVMSKIKELTSKGMGGQQDQQNTKPDQNKPPNQNPHASHPNKNQPNPLIQQEQQPMYMSLEEIHKLPDSIRGVALAMYNENAKLRTEMEASKKVTDSLRDAKLKEASVSRQSRVALLGRLSPRVKADLEAMLALPSMALSMGDGGAVLDPMAQTLAVLEKGLADLPRLLTTDASALSVQPQPQDADMLTDERTTEIADSLARQMGCPPQAKAS